MASAPVPIARSRCVVASARMRNTPSDSWWGPVVNSEPGFCCGPVNSVSRGTASRCASATVRQRRWKRHTLASRGLFMASTGSARGGERISILYSFPHALGAPGIGWTAWNQVNELVRAGHDVHLAAASIARPVARPRLGEHVARRRRPAHPAPRHGTRSCARLARPVRRTCGRPPIARRRARVAARRDADDRGGASSRHPGVPGGAEHAHGQRVRGRGAGIGQARAHAARRRIARRRPGAARDRGAGVGDGLRTARPVGCRRRHVPRARLRRRRGSAGIATAAPPRHPSCGPPGRTTGSSRCSSDASNRGRDSITRSTPGSPPRRASGGACSSSAPSTTTTWPCSRIGWRTRASSCAG